MGHKSKKLTKHHRFPESHGGRINYPEDNISYVTHELHCAWHMLMINKTAPEIAKHLNTILYPLLQCKVRLVKK